MATTTFWDKYTSQRLSRRRALQAAGVTGAAAGAIALVGCSDDNKGDKTPSSGTTPSGSGQGTPKLGGTLEGQVSQVLGKDPVKASSFVIHALASFAYSRLMRFKTTPGELDQADWYTPVPEIASKVENPDPLTYVFTLRGDVKFHNLPPVNGRLLNADDVVYSFNRYRELAPNKANLGMVDTVTASADKTQVTFKLKQPFGLFLNRIASFQDLWIMPREFIESSPTAAEDSMLGSGPFMFEKYEPGVVISWIKNPDYFEKDAAGTALPYIDRVKLNIITDQNQVLSQFAAGKLDTISVPPQLIDSVRGQTGDATINQSYRNILSMLIFEPASFLADKPPFNDIRVRQGMSRAVNRDAILNRISSEGGKWPNMPINAGFGETWWLDPQGSDIGDAGKNYQYDVTEAKALFSAAGVSEFTVPMHFSSTTYTTAVPYYDIVREALPALLAEVGVTANLVPEEYGQYITTTFNGQFDGFALSLESVFGDIGAYWENMFRPRDAGGARNHSSVSDAELVTKIEAMLALTDIEEIREANFELQRYTSDKMYYVPMVTPVEYGANSARLKGTVNSTGPTTYAAGTEIYMNVWLDA